MNCTYALKCDRTLRSTPYARSNQGAQFLVPTVCYPSFKPYEIHDEKQRLEIDHQLYLQSPELRECAFQACLSLARIVFSRAERSASRSCVQRWTQPILVINSGHDEEVVASTGKRAEKTIDSTRVDRLDVHVSFALLHARENITRGHGLQSCVTRSNGGQISFFPTGLCLHAGIRKSEIDRRRKRTIEI